MGRNIKNRGLQDSGDPSQYFDDNGFCTFEASKTNPYPIEVIEYTKELFFSGMTLPNASKHTGINYDTIVSWARKYKWENQLEKVVEKTEKKYVKKRVEKALSQREKMDQKHTRMIQWLQKEIHDEVTKKTHSKAEDDRKQVRMKTLKIATDCYIVLMNKEREIAGVSDGDVQDKIAEKYEFEIIDASGQSIETQSELKQLLPNQDPHNYSLKDAVIKVEAKEVVNRVSEANAGKDFNQAVQQTKIKKINLGVEPPKDQGNFNDFGIM